MPIRTFVRVAASLILTSLLVACGGGGHFTPVTDPATSTQPAQQALQQNSSNSDASAVQTDGLQTMSTVQPTTASFLPSSYGKIGTFQIFDETNNGTISASAAIAHGYRYNAVWGARPGMGSPWRTGNAGIRASYYFIAVTDASTSSWGGIGHSLTWWREHHPDWVLYACTSAGAPTHTPASVVGLPNVPLNIRNPAVANYQMHLIAPYALARGYNALGADEVTFWFAGTGGPGYYPCGIWEGTRFVRLYGGRHDLRYATDMVNWVRTAHAILRTSYPTLKLIVNHPADSINGYEQQLLANVDGDLDETGFTSYGNYHNSRFVMETEWMRYAQTHGVTVLINQDWGHLSVGPAQRDYSVATYLMGNEQAAATFISPHTGYGIEVWRSEYATSVGAPCGQYFNAGGSVYMRRFANAIAVVNASPSSGAYAHLPTGHGYSDLEGRAVRNPLALEANDGYVLRTTNGCH